MFESAELGHAITKQTYARQVPKLRESLLDAQYDLFEDGRFPVIVLIGGMDGAGKGETVNLLNEWMDPRHMRTVAFGEPSDEERERPPMWRYWQALPPKGKIGILFGHWYTQPILDRVKGEARHPQLVQRIEDIVRFERMLGDEGALILKFWFHLSKAAQKKRLKSLQKDPKTRWKVSDTEWADFKLYDKFRKVSEFTLRQTSSATAPWIVVEGVDACYRSLTAGRTLLAAMRERLDRKPAKVKEDRIAPLPPAIDHRNIVRSLDLNLKLERSKYEKLLDDYRTRLNLLSRHPRFRNRSVVLAFEGNDAAGKGSAIRRVAQALDARQYRIVPVAAPTEEERAQPYLWRFWRQVPRHGRFAIFDRSWYGRVLVERVEGFASEFDWMRAYPEINDFEQQLEDNGAIVIKFWLAISKEEQYRRFKERQKTAFKRFKITPEDWRNRKKWDAYEKAVCDMVDRTSTDIAPWTLVEANDKLHARAKVLRTICDRMEAVLKRPW
ncbi:MAG: polyphosphate:AMP phosphotransferase [Betaproteobacteria bacterium]|nr:polyphosphate:AMP phosphotransferase [Betaproteobacteria bacterium]